MLQLPLLLDILDVEVEPFRRAVAQTRRGLGERFDSQIVIPGVDIVHIRRAVAQKLDQVILVHRVDHIPRILGVLTRAGRLDGRQKMLQTILPDLGAHILAFLFQDVDEKRHLAQIERIVLKRQFGIFADRVDFLFGV